MSCPDGLSQWELKVPSFLECLGAFLLALPAVTWSAKVLFDLESEVNVAAYSAELILALALVIVLHESVHALVYALGGVGVSAGLGPYYAYIAAKKPLSKNLFLKSALSPLAVISLSTAVLAKAFPELSAFLLMVFVLNFLGSVGDLILTLRILPAPADVTIVDAGDLALVCLPPSEARPPPSWWSLMGRFLRAFPLALAVSAVIGTVLLRFSRVYYETGVGFETRLALGALEYGLAVALSGVVALLKSG